MVYCFSNLNFFCSPPLGASKYKKHSNLMENEQDMPFQNEGDCALVFFICVWYEFEV